MLITPVITINSENDFGYNRLLKSIDNKIADIVTIQYLNDVYGFNVHVDKNLFNDLCEYREILLDKLMGCNCLNDEYLIFITSNIERLIDNQI